MAIEISCMLEAPTINALGTCFELYSGGIFWNLIYISLLVFMVMGWSLVNRVNIGMMVGGFIMSLIGTAMMAFQKISVFSVMTAIAITLIGVFLTFILRDQ